MNEIYVSIFCITICIIALGTRKKIFPIFGNILIFLNSLSLLLITRDGEAKEFMIMAILVLMFLLIMLGFFGMTQLNFSWKNRGVENKDSFYNN